MLQRTLPAGFIAPCLPTKIDKLPLVFEWRPARTTEDRTCAPGGRLSTIRERDEHRAPSSDPLDYRPDRRCGQSLTFWLL